MNVQKSTGQIIGWGRAMLKYVIKDICSMLYVLPYGFLVGIVAFIWIRARNRRRRNEGRAFLHVPAAVCFYMYLAILLAITFFSRESGSEQGIDLELFSTFRINVRNTAYVIENILLFIPFGYVVPWYLQSFRGFWRCAGAGLGATLAIETLQLVTGRGIFQIDDILTNLLGSLIGYGCFWLFQKLFRRSDRYA